MAIKSGLSTKANDLLIKNYKRALNDIRAEMVRTAEKYSGNGIMSTADAMLYARDKGMIDNIIRKLDDLNATNLKIERDIQAEAYKESYYNTIFNIDKQTGFLFTVESPAFSLINFTAVEKLANNETFMNAVKNMGSATKSRIKTTIMQAILQGKSIPEITKQIKIDLGKSENSALFIARTETHKAVESASESAVQYAEDNGVKITKKWLSTKDDRTRPDHREMDGRTADTEIDGEYYFTLPDGDYILGPGLDGPGGTQSKPETVINCRCTTLNLVDDYTPKTMRTMDGVESYKTYNEWKEAKIQA
jgi:SPP1 gp7 family putative phage head morphogenesis protein